jgi:hypothetical protein
VFGYFVAADEWILNKVFQPIVNWVWENTGISRRSLCRIAITIASFQNCTQHKWFLILSDFWLFVSTWFPSTKIDLRWFSIFRFIMLVFLVFDVTVFLVDHDILILMTSISFVSYLYFMQAEDPPTKRKNWKSALDKLFASQWTWLQPSAAK